MTCLETFFSYAGTIIQMQHPHVSILILSLDYEGLVLKSRLILLWIPPKMPITFPSFCYSKKTVEIEILWNVYHLSFDKTNQIQANLTLETCLISLL